MFKSAQQGFENKDDPLEESCPEQELSETGTPTITTCLGVTWGEVDIAHATIDSEGSWRAQDHGFLTVNSWKFVNFVYSCFSLQMPPETNDFSFSCAFQMLQEYFSLLPVIWNYTGKRTAGNIIPGFFNAVQRSEIIEGGHSEAKLQADIVQINPLSTQYIHTYPLTIFSFRVK